MAERVKGETRRALGDTVGLGAALSFVLCAAMESNVWLATTRMASSFALECALLIATACLAAIFALACAKGRFLLSIALVTGFLGAAGMIAMGANGAFIQSSTVPMLCGVMLGCSIAAVSFIWAEYLVHVRPVELVRRSCGASIIAGVALSIYTVLPSLAADGIFLAALIVISLVWIWLVAGQENNQERGWSPSGPRASLRLLTALSDGADRLERASKGEAKLGDIFLMLWIPLSGMLFVGFITGLLWDPVTSVELNWRGPWVRIAGYLAGPLIAGGSMLVVCRNRTDSQCLSLLSRVVTPIAMAVVLVIPVIKQTIPGAFAAGACNAASTAGFVGLSLAAFIALEVTARLTDLPAARVVGIPVVALALMCLAGVGVITVVGETGRTICLVLEAVLLAAVCVCYALRARGIDGPVDEDEADLVAAAAVSAASEAAAVSAVKPAQSQTANITVSSADDTAPADDPDALFRTRCETIATQSNLSQREAEVLQFLARGHSSRYIATELHISENTVRTHVRHIYEKCGVNSREGLFARVDGRVEE